MTKPYREFEIKLAGAPRDVAALRRSHLVRSKATSRGAWERLTATYYDTPTAELTRAGVSLRIRTSAGERIQTIKREENSLSTLDRFEFETELRNLEAFPISPGEAVIDAILDEARERIAPVSRTVTDRWHATVEHGGAGIELSIDLGVAERWTAEGRFAGPIAEAELELVDGDRAAAFSLARFLIEESGGRLRPALRSKSAQAQALGRTRARLTPSKPPKLPKDATVGDALAGTLAEIAGQVIDLIPFIAETREEEGVHQMRVALRRLRAIERLFRAAAGDEDLRRLGAQARIWAQRLGPARDWDVFAARALPLALGQNRDETPATSADGRDDDPATEHASGQARGQARAGGQRLAARVEEMRAEAWSAAAEAVSTPAFAIFALDLLECAAVRRSGASENRPLRGKAATFAAEALDDRLAAADALAPALGVGDPAAGHPLRIALKKLRYAAQTFRSLYPKARRKPYMSALSRLQDAFGALNDAVVAQRLADEAADGQGVKAANAAGFLAGYRAAEAAEAARSVHALWVGFRAQEPFWRAGAGPHEDPPGDQMSGAPAGLRPGANETG